MYFFKSTAKVQFIPFFQSEIHSYQCLNLENQKILEPSYFPFFITFHFLYSLLFACISNFMNQK